MWLGLNGLRCYELGRGSDMGLGVGSDMDSGMGSNMESGVGLGVSLDVVCWGVGSCVSLDVVCLDVGSCVSLDCVVCLYMGFVIGLGVGISVDSRRTSG